MHIITLYTCMRFSSNKRIFKETLGLKEKEINFIEGPLLFKCVTNTLSFYSFSPRLIDMQSLRFKESGTPEQEKISTGDKGTGLIK